MTATMGDSIRRRRGVRRGPAPGPRPRWLRVGLFALGGAALAFGIGYVLAVYVLFPAPVLSAPGIVVPRLAGQDTAFAARSLAERRLRLGAVTEVPDPAAAPGAIVAQDALPGQQLRAGATVNVAISSGAAKAVLPDVTGYGAARAVALLSALGFQVSQVSVPASVPAGQVAAVTPQPGMAYELPGQVTLSISAGPPPDTTALPADSTAPPDSLNATPAGTPVRPSGGVAPAPAPAPGSPGAAPAAPVVPAAHPPAGRSPAAPANPPAHPPTPR